ncbi:MAG TPA: hypothetical protein VGI19_03265, partial [Candidatus Cybelea sp.]
MTRRAEPTKSWESAWRHLFRHIDEPKELQRNPIAANFLERNGTIAGDAGAVRLIRGAVCEALGEYELGLRSRGEAERARRRRAIVESNVLGHRSTAELASELHVSRMQVYRERRAVCEYLARALGYPTPRTHRVVLAGSPQAAVITRARLLLERCQTERALELLDDVARSCGDPQMVIRATCLMADTLTGGLEVEKARRQL